MRLVAVENGSKNKSTKPRCYCTLLCSSPNVVASRSYRIHLINGLYDYYSLLMEQALNPPADIEQHSINLPTLLGVASTTRSLVFLQLSDTYSNELSRVPQVSATQTHLALISIDAGCPQFPGISALLYPLLSTTCSHHRTSLKAPRQEAQAVES